MSGTEQSAEQQPNEIDWSKWKPDPYALGVIHMKIHANGAGCCCLEKVICPGCPTHKGEYSSALAKLNAEFEAQKDELNDWRARAEAAEYESKQAWKEGMEWRTTADALAADALTMKARAEEAERELVYFKSATKGYSEMVHDFANGLFSAIDLLKHWPLGTNAHLYPEIYDGAQLDDDDECEVCTVTKALEDQCLRIRAPSHSNRMRASTGLP